MTPSLPRPLARPFLACSLALALAATADAGGVAVLELDANGRGSVRRYDETTGLPAPVPAQLTDLELLPLDATRRTWLEEFLPGRARLSIDVPAASRVLLPGRKGSLYHYTRVVAGGSRAYGFFRVTLDGRVELAHELSGVGALGEDDPFLPRVAIAPAGDAMLVATTLPAGGDVLEIRFGATPLVFDRTATLPPRRFFPESLALADTWGVCGMRRGALRFDRTPAAQAQSVDYGSLAVPSVFSGAVVLSQNGQWAAIAAGATRGALDVYVFGPSGPAGIASTVSLPVSSAGWLPQAEDGPHMAVADDGATAAWRTEPAPPAYPARESWIGRVHVPPADPNLHVSSDALFLDTLDEIGLFIFRTPSRLQLGVGDAPNPGENALENTDLFQLDVPSTLHAGTFTNLTLSSGDATAPFLSVPSISVARSALVGSATWFHDDDGSAEEIAAIVEGASGAQTVLPSVKQLVAWEFVAGWAWLSIRADGGNQDYELWRVPIDLSQPASRIATTPDDTFGAYTVRADGLVAFANRRATNPMLARVQLATGALEVHPGQPASYGPTLATTARGGVAFSRRASATAPVEFAVWNDTGTVTLQSSALDGFVLPAR